MKLQVYKLKWFILLLVTAFQFSCDSDFLDETTNPNSFSPSSFWQNDDDAFKALTSVYANLQPDGNWGTIFTRYIIIPSYRSDECVRRDDVSSWIKLASFTNDATNSTAKHFWNTNYSGIYRANQLFEGIELIPDMNAELKKAYIAEAKFLRAFYYFTLLKNFGGKIPLITTPIQGADDYYPAQSDYNTIMAFIETELKACLGILPSTYDDAMRGRITDGAVSALLGKVYLYQEKYNDASTEFAKLIAVSPSVYDLASDYNANFDGDNRGNKEAVFEAMFGGDASGGRKEYNYITLHLSSFDGDGYEEAYPSEWLYQLMKNDTLSDGSYSDRIFNTIEFPEGLAFSNNGSTKPYEEVHGADATKIYWKKFVNWSEGQTANMYRSGFNVPIIRFADVLLMYAEALNEASGPSNDVFDAIDRVRSRVDIVPIDRSMNKEQLREHIRHVERPCELALEGNRYYDLNRWGITKDALTQHGKRNAASFVVGKHELLAIPRSELTLNSDWEQNPQYGK